jgi:hypothetical protein
MINQATSSIAQFIARANAYVPVRYSAWGLCIFAALLSLFSLIAFNVGWLPAIVFISLSVLGARDVRQAKHAILRNYPVIGHARFLLEYIRPEMRQYFLESDNEAAPFSRSQRSRQTPIWHAARCGCRRL